MLKIHSVCTFPSLILHARVQLPVLFLLATMVFHLLSTMLPCYSLICYFTFLVQFQLNSNFSNSYNHTGQVQDEQTFIYYKPNVRYVGDIEGKNCYSTSSLLKTMNYIEQEYGIKLKESDFNNNSIISELIDFSIKNIEGNLCNRFLTT